MVSKIWEVYENLNEIVYVADVDTYELVYMNKKARDIFKVSKEDVKKHICYQLLQNSNTPCSMCTNSKIIKDSFYEWVYFNPITNVAYSLKDTIIEDSGKRYRMELAFEISAQEKHKKTLAEVINTEVLINEALKYALAEDHPEKSIIVFLEYVGKALKGERSYIFEQVGDICNNTYEWCASGVIPQKDNLQNVSLKDLALWYEKFDDHELIIVDDMERVKVTDPKLYDILAPQGIQALVVTPLMCQNRIIGFLGIDNPPSELTKYIYNILMLSAQFVVSLINRRDLVNQLEALSYYDQLTGANNRHALDKLYKTYDSNKNAGILFVDVMGLKKVNDTYGHAQGDKLLIDAYTLLTMYFDKKTVYRVGGDEFVAISFDMSKEEFEANIRNLRILMEQGEVRMALGSVWADRESGYDLNVLIRQADELMYEDKRAFYRARKEFDRRS